MSDSKTNGGPAFPSQELNHDGTPYHLNQGMTLRQYAAIKLHVPDSGTEWLDDMIRQSLRGDFAAKAMQGCIASGRFTGYADCAADSYAMADAMLSAREDKQ